MWIAGLIVWLSSLIASRFHGGQIYKHPLEATVLRPNGLQRGACEVCVRVTWVWCET